MSPKNLSRVLERYLATLTTPDESQFQPSTGQILDFLKAHDALQSALTDQTEHVADNLIELVQLDNWLKQRIVRIAQTLKLADWRTSLQPPVRARQWLIESSTHWWNRGQALRAAQKEIRDNPEWAHPYYWAAFVLTGDPGIASGAISVLPFSISNWGLWTAGIGAFFLVVLASSLLALSAGKRVEKRRLRDQLKMLLIERQRLMSESNTPKHAQALRQISYQLREIGRRYHTIGRKNQ